MERSEPVTDSPLTGVTVLVPRSQDQAPALSERIRELGGVPVEAPVIEIRPGDRPALAEACRALAAGRFRAVAFTSPNGARAVAEVLAGTHATADAWQVDLIAAVGPGTARALRQELGVEADLVPATATTSALAAALPPGPGAILLPRADLATPTLADGLRDDGWDVSEVTAYVTARPDSLPPDASDQLRTGRIDLVAVASSSTARNLAELVDDLRGARIVSIGPVTSATCRELGFEVAVEADPHTLDGLVDALVVAVEAA